MEAKKVKLQFCEAQIRQEENTVRARKIIAGISTAMALRYRIIQKIKITSISKSV